MKFAGTVLAVILLVGDSWCQTEESCDEENLHASAEMCTEQRSVLSEASAHAVETRNHTVLCKAFAEYMRCMEPKIGHCNSTFTGFTVIRSTYSASPYNCSAPPAPAPVEPKPPAVGGPGGGREGVGSTTPGSSSTSRPSPPGLLPLLCLTLTSALTAAIGPLRH